MTIRKTLIGIVLAGALTLSGCSDKDRSQYHFNGKIGKDQVEFFEKRK